MDQSLRRVPSALDVGQMTLTVCAPQPTAPGKLGAKRRRLRRLRLRDVSTNRQRGPCFGKLRLSWGIRPLMPPHEKLSAETEEEAQSPPPSRRRNKNLRLCARSRGRQVVPAVLQGSFTGLTDHVALGPRLLPSPGPLPRKSSCRAI